MVLRRFVGVRDCIFGIEKDYRLARVAKISLFMNGAGDGNILFGDGLDNYKDQGVDISIVSNSYDMEIDKQCVAYERSLTDANEEMNQTVRNAKSVLQRARLLVAQEKNSYDLRGCAAPVFLSE